MGRTGLLRRNTDGEIELLFELESPRWWFKPTSSSDLLTTTVIEQIENEDKSLVYNQ